nr:SRPBCC family protein [Endozoicomonas sp.]
DLTGCELHPGPKEGRGASRRVFRTNGKFLDETVTHWEEKRGFVIRLHEGTGPAPAPFKEACFIYRIQPIGDKTRLTTTMSYTTRFGFIGKLLNKLFIKKALNGAVSKISRNMKSFYETGTPSNKTISEA